MPYVRISTYHNIVTNVSSIVKINIANFRNIKFTSNNNVKSQTKRKQKEYWFNSNIPDDTKDSGRNRYQKFHQILKYSNTHFVNQFDMYANAKPSAFETFDCWT